MDFPAFLYVSNLFGLSYTYERNGTVYAIGGHVYFILLLTCSLLYGIHLDSWLLANRPDFVQLRTLFTLIYSQIIIFIPVIFLAYFRIRCKRVTELAANITSVMELAKQLLVGITTTSKTTFNINSSSSSRSIFALSLAVALIQSFSTAAHVYFSGRKRSLTAASATALLKMWSGLPMILYSSYLLSIRNALIEILSRFCFTTGGGNSLFNDESRNLSSLPSKRLSSLKILHGKIVQFLQMATRLYGFSVCLTVMLIVFDVSNSTQLIVRPTNRLSIPFLTVQMACRFSPVMMLFYSAEQVSRKVRMSSSNCGKLLFLFEEFLLT